MAKKHSALLMRTYVILVFCFMYLPIAVMIAFSFNESKSRSNFTGFTLGWYKSLFHNEMILSALGLSLVLALVSSIIATVLGTLATLGINSMSRKSQLIINNISYVPVFLSENVLSPLMPRNKTMRQEAPYTLCYYHHSDKHDKYTAHPLLLQM